MRIDINIIKLTILDEYLMLSYTNTFVCVAAAIGTCFVSVASLPHESGNGETMMNALSLSFPIWCDPRASLLENEPLDTLKIGN